jgi:hypothetical protein
MTSFPTRRAQPFTVRPALPPASNTHEHEVRQQRKAAVHQQRQVAQRQPGALHRVAARRRPAASCHPLERREDRVLVGQPAPGGAQGCLDDGGGRRDRRDVAGDISGAAVAGGAGEVVDQVEAFELLNLGDGLLCGDVWGGWAGRGG